MMKQYIVSEAMIDRVLMFFSSDESRAIIKCILQADEYPKSTAQVALDEICSKCPITNEEPLDDDRCAEFCDGCLVREVGG